ncbi:hypothetical protein [Helicobacter pylori]|uniref:hypothetical protein n=1 Tax=Helicobacter pylori TaxID=210 RepID=UPI0013E2BDB8|nr:hypothetical protein [Helicobacter pylori]
MTRYIFWGFSFRSFLANARFALSCLILLTQKQLRLTPTLSNCDALLSMLANASLIGVCLVANNSVQNRLNASLTLALRFCLG